jgi:hypothetical protein
MKTRTTASATCVASAGFTITPVGCAKSLWPVMPPMASRNQIPGSTRRAVLHLDGGEADVVRILKHRDDAAAVEADVELARDAVERPVVEDVEMPLARMRPRVDQFLGIDAGGRRACDVADVIGARAARAQAEILDVLDQGDGVLRLDLADLQVGPRRHMGIAAAEALRGVGHTRELRGLENAVGYAQPAHVGVRCRRAEEQAEETPAEIIVRLGRRVGRGLAFQLFIAVERMQFALELLLVGELVARPDHPVLGAPMGRVGSGRLRRRGRRGRRGASAAGDAPGRLRDLQAGDETFEITLLFRLEITCHGYSSSPCRIAARVERSETRGRRRRISRPFPDFAALNPGCGSSRRYSAATVAGARSAAAALAGLYVQ